MVPHYSKSDLPLDIRMYIHYLHNNFFFEKSFMRGNKQMSLHSTSHTTAVFNSKHKVRVVSSRPRSSQTVSTTTVTKIIRPFSYFLPLQGVPVGNVIIWRPDYRFVDISTEILC